MSLEFHCAGHQMTEWIRVHISWQFLCRLHPLPQIPTNVWRKKHRHPHGCRCVSAFWAGIQIPFDLSKSRHPIWSVASACKLLQAITACSRPRVTQFHRFISVLLFCFRWDICLNYSIELWLLFLRQNTNSQYGEKFSIFNCNDKNRIEIMIVSDLLLTFRQTLNLWHCSLNSHMVHSYF